MGTVLLKCQVTGRYFSAGFDTDPVTFAALPDVAMRTNCPHCGGQHLFANQTRMLVDPHRWAADPKVEDCLIKATQCAELASDAQASSRKRQFLRMEQQWLKLAQDYRRITATNGSARRRRSDRSLG